MLTTKEALIERAKYRPKIVFFTGAGVSAESGLPTFRGEDGIWNDIDAEAVASKRAWYCGRYSNAKERRQRVLDFFNPMRRAILDKTPNDAHHTIAKFEEFADVTVITQNGDDFHERVVLQMYCTYMVKL